MITDIVNLLRTATSKAMSMTVWMFDKTGTWGLVFAGISIVLITRFILGPVLGFSYVGSSDCASPKPKGRGRGYKVSQGRARAGDSDGMLNSGFSRAGDL